MAQMNGGCLCGAIRYSTTAEPSISAVCHCRDRQKFTGSAFGTLIGIPRQALTITGTMKTYTSPGGSGKPILRHFCPECGSSVAEEPATLPDLVLINVGTLDEPKSVNLALEIFCDDALPWVHMTNNPTRFPKMPS